MTLNQTQQLKSESSFVYFPIKLDLSFDSLRLFPAKSIFSHVSDRITTTEGLFEVLKVGEYATTWLQMMPQMSSKEAPLRRAQRVFFSGATLASMPGLAKSVADTIHSVSLLAGIFFDKTRSLSDKNKELVILAPKSARNVLDLACMGADAANNLHELGWVNLGSAAPVVSGVFYGTDIVGNGLDLATEVQKITERSFEKVDSTISESRRLAVLHKDNLSYIQIFKGAVCIVGSAMGLASLFISGLVVLPIVGLVISSLWIVTKIVADFYKEIVVKSDAKDRGVSL